MKRFLVIICALALSLCAFAACNSDNATGYERLPEIAALMNLDYSGYKLEVKTQKGGAELENTFEVTFIEGGYYVDYKIESLNAISLDDDNEYKSDKSGRATVTENGKKVTVNDDAVDVEFEKLQSTGLSFTENCLKNLKISDGKLTADVSAPSTFIGSKTDATAMKVEANFGAKMQSITITYTLDGATVTCNYTFA